MTLRNATGVMLVSGASVLPLRRPAPGLSDPPVFFEIAPQRSAPLDLDAEEFRYRWVAGKAVPVRPVDSLPGSRCCATPHGRRHN